jgi:hypothetical protein
MFWALLIWPPRGLSQKGEGTTNLGAGFTLAPMEGGIFDHKRVNFDL